MQFSFKQSLIKAAKAFLIFLLPFLVDQFIVNVPNVAQLTIGGALIIIVDYLKRKYAGKNS